MECCCSLRNIQDLLSDGETLYEQRFGETFKGPIIPVGLMIEYHPIFAQELSKLHQFGEKVLLVICLRYAFVARRIWKIDILVADIEDLENMDPSEIHAKRLNVKEVLTPMNDEKILCSQLQMVK